MTEKKKKKVQGRGEKDVQIVAADRTSALFFFGV